MKFVPGTVVVDTSRCKAGTITDVDGSKLTLVRPSGLVWEADAEVVRLADSIERLSVVASREKYEAARGLGE